MEDSVYRKYGINPNRIPTDAELKAIAYCFGESEEEAKKIARLRRGVRHGMKRKIVSSEVF